MNSLISVIIPIYNVEHYLDKCLDSIISQTYCNLEIILVNDGSTDESRSICENYLKKDSRISLINKENGGLSDARNVGIESSTGEYLTFIDSDDYVAENFIESLYKLIIKYKADIAITNLLIVKDGMFLTKKNNPYEKKYNVIEALTELCYSKKFGNSAVAKLYKRELFNDIKYPKGRLFEDVATTYKLFDRAKLIVYKNVYQYYYIQRSGSIMNSLFNKRRMDGVYFAEEMKRFITEKYNNATLSDAVKARLCSGLMSIFEVIPIKFYKNNQYIEYCYDLLKKNRKYVIRSNCRLKVKIYCIISFLGIYQLKLSMIIVNILKKFRRKEKI